ncbi:HAD domain-containing protein [Streptomyces sp. NBC_00239]|uniref:HAD domain-containing protein n=1 Tax=Streptomyces sp. NBC_00239 TaxID=2903640 RepID=UPI002E2D9B6E|nr:HAD domain-containing protein [Streptomyces sp. NBC_00239]
MTGSAVQRPLLFLDVDGPLIPFGATEPYPTYPAGSEPPGGDAHPLLTRLDPGHGARLAMLPCDLVWATTWMDDANELVAPRIGLPRLPVVTWPEPSAIDGQDERLGLHWKTRTLVEWAAGRPFIWVDDEITGIDRAWVATHHRGRALLHRVDARQGLTDTDYVSLDAWLREAGPSTTVRHSPAGGTRSRG